MVATAALKKEFFVIRVFIFVLVVAQRAVVSTP
jgi:hypothetical protein